MEPHFPFDHLMVCTSEPERAVASLRAFGLVHGALGPQSGTGAEHAVFFFNNAYLEVAWPGSAGPAFKDAPRLHFQERASSPATGWCPFGLSFRTPDPSCRELPLSTWHYAAPFLPPGAVPIPIGSNSNVRGEPLIIVSLVSQRPDTRVPTPPLQAARGLAEVTHLRLFSPSAAKISEELAAVQRLGWLSIVPGASYHAELEFAEARAGSEHNFAPELPLTFRW